MPLNGFGNVPEIRRDSHRPAACAETETYGVDRVVGNRERRHSDVSDGKNGAGLKCFDDGLAPVPIDPWCRKCRQIHWNLAKAVISQSGGGMLGQYGQP